MVPIFKLLAPSQYVNDRDRRTIREFEMDEHEHEVDSTRVDCVADVGAVEMLESANIAHHEQ